MSDQDNFIDTEEEEFNENTIAEIATTTTTTTEPPPDPPTVPEE
jgi:hypothetical protein